MVRIRHCVECPRCFTRYLIPSSPYSNGSYLIPTVNGSLQDYALYCSCCRATVARWIEVIACEVSKTAYARGYGSAKELIKLHESARDAAFFDPSRYLGDWKSDARRRNSY